MLGPAWLAPITGCCKALTCSCSLPPSLWQVAAHGNLSGGLVLKATHSARDGTHKLVFDLVGGEGTATGTIETVLIPMTNRQGTGLRYTACVSTQVGCAMNCQVGGGGEEGRGWGEL